MKISLRMWQDTQPFHVLLDRAKKAREAYAQLEQEGVIDAFAELDALDAAANSYAGSVHRRIDAYLRGRMPLDGVDAE